MSEPTDMPLASSSSPLQFDRAEIQGDPESQAQAVECAFCRTPLYSYYFDINGRMACEACRYKIEEQLQTGPGVSGFLRACAAGFGAAVVGAGIYYAVLAGTGYEVGLISILVGFMVGKAVHWGARGRGGWVYQSLAVFLTYMAIVSTYIPLMFKEFAKQDQAKQEAAAVAPPDAAATPAALETAAPGPKAQPPGEPSPTFGELVVGVVMIFALAAAMPFLAGFQNVLGILIIAFGLWEAWKLNKRPALEILGPLTIGTAPSTATLES